MDYRRGAGPPTRARSPDRAISLVIGRPVPRPARDPLISHLLGHWGAGPPTRARSPDRAISLVIGRPVPRPARDPLIAHLLGHWEAGPPTRARSPDRAISVVIGGRVPRPARDPLIAQSTPSLYPNRSIAFSSLCGRFRTPSNKSPTRSNRCSALPKWNCSGRSLGVTSF